MRKRHVRRAPVDPIQANRRLALTHLLAAHDVAREAGKDARSYACQLSSLQSQGVTDTSLRWLIDHHLAEHLLETTTPENPDRTFARSHNSHLKPASCFSLTPSGVFVARETAAKGQGQPADSDRPELTPH